MDEKILVYVCDDAHPHARERGYLTGEVITMVGSGERMAKVALEGCVHGTDACFVSKGQIAQLPMVQTRRRKR